ncbi:aldo/keto reductase [Edaphobacter modestus]|uniref:aldo/keto reductase n=1 Tax=Edaphobacter modestus TaxID=388466 RepID=UPI001A919EAF
MSFGDPTKGRHSWILSRPIIRHVVESGINFFDTASMSGAGTSEDVLGRAIKAMRRCVRHLQSPQLRNPSTAITLPTGTATAVGANPNFGLISATRLPVGDLGCHVNSKSEVRSSSKWPAVIYRVQNAAPQT